VDIDRYTLHRARVTAGLPLEELARRTRISPGLLKLIDDGQFERLPGGIYARSYVRAVARIVAVDPEEAVRALLPLMRDAELGIEQDAAGEDSPAPAAPAAVAPPQAQPFTAWMASDEDWRRWGASAVDGAVLAGLWMILWGIARVAAGPYGIAGLAAVSVTAAVLAVIYFAVFAGLGGATPGDQLLRVSRDAARGPVHGSAAGRRALTAMLVKASIIVDIVATTEWGLDALRIKSVE
jgi:hypothetical protein